MQPVIRERRFALELWELNPETLDKGDSVPVCELEFFNASFSLNTLPQAVVAPLLGKIINDTGKDATASTAVLVDKIFEFSKNRVPVGVILKVHHSFSSNELDTVDKQYWKPDISLIPDSFGLYKTNEIFIFKGYIAPPTLDIINDTAQIRLIIYHWLLDIADISLLTSYCHTTTPKELALQLYDTPTEDKDQPNTWSIITQRDIQLKQPKALWENGIKPMFNTLVQFYKKDNFYNKYTENRRKAICNAIDRIKADTSLTVDMLNLDENSHTLDWCIAKALKAESYLGFINTTGWDKLVSQYGPNFLFSVVPRVENALIIPTPTTVNTQKYKITVLKDNDIFRLMSSPLSTNILNRIICTPTVPTDTTQSNNEGSATYIEMSTYPPANIQADRRGSIATVTYPNWLNIVKPEKQQNPTKQLKLQQNYIDSDAMKAVERKKEALEQIKKDKKLISARWAQFVYLMQVYNPTWLNITTPVRMDICPGAMICCELSDAYILKQIDKDLDTDSRLKLYGTVTTVSVNILAGSHTSYSQISLSNIRTEQVAKDNIENPQTSVGLYKEQWTGKDIPLYGEI